MTVTIHSPGEGLLTETEIEPWRSIPVAVAADLAPDEQLDILIRPINPPGQQPALCGRAVTVLCKPPDFGAVLRSLEMVGPGDVLVIAAGGRVDAAMIGEILSGFLRARGCAGVVCDGAIRDVSALAGWKDFAVFTRAVNPRGPTGSSEGTVQGPVMIGDRIVNPGDLILGDDDGLIALTPATVRERIVEARAKLELERQWTDSLASGGTVAQTFGLSEG